MRNKHMISAALLVLASASMAGAQQRVTATRMSSAPAGTLELGYRGTPTTGDDARFQRYRDLRSGAAVKFSLGKETDTMAYEFNAANVGFKDQTYAFGYSKFGKLKVSAEFAGQPLNYANNTLTPYVYTGNNKWTLDAAARTQVQNKVAGVIGIGTNAATDVPTIFRNLATTFPMAVHRDALSVGAKFRGTERVAIDVAFKTTKKSGNQPWGAAFAFNDAVNLPMAIDNRTNEITAGMELNKPQTGMLRAEYQGSFFKNNFKTLEWDNPLRATDYDNGKLPPNGPWDASGYSNGNGPAYGRMAMAPSNMMNTVRVFGLFKMPGHTTVNGQVAVTRMTEDEQILPYTTNTKIANAATYATFPGLAALPRQSAEARVDGLNAVVNFATRPTDYFGFDMKYRFNDHENKTPLWDGSYNVRFDAVPEYVPGTETEHFNIRQNTLEAGATLTVPRRGTALKLGFIMDDFKREGRAFSDMTDYTVRASLDAYQNQYVTVRGIVERTSRAGSGLSLENIEEGGGQHALRFYDEADMDRLKGSVILAMMPSSKFDVNVSFNSSDDRYNGEGHEFGLLSSRNNSMNASANVYLTDRITVGGMYGLDRFSSHQASRNANPVSGVVGAYESFNDVNRTWYLDNTEHVTTAGAWVDLIKALPNTDLRVAFNYSDSDNGLDLNGPRIEQFKAPDNLALRSTGDTRACSTGIASCFIPLPNVTNSWTQVRVDLKHMFRPALGIGVGYMYENLGIVDFATTDVSPGVPRMDPLGAITTGYGNRPYTGSVITTRLIYTF